MPPGISPPEPGVGELADGLSKSTGRRITYVNITPAQFIKERVATGLPEVQAKFISKWLDSIARVDLAEVTKDLEYLIKWNRQHIVSCLLPATISMRDLKELGSS